MNNSLKIPIIVGKGAYKFGKRMQGMHVIKKLCHLKLVLCKIRSLIVNITLDIRSLLLEMKMSYLSSNKAENILNTSRRSNY